jgi:type III pantothenate kinase
MVAHRFAHEPLFVTSRMKTGLTIHYSNPAELGSDRIANAAAAFHQYRTDVIVVDLGTATTFSVVTREGEFVGGAIAPGLGIAAEALYSRTALLPRVPLRQPLSVIGHDTSSNIQSGLLLGHAGLVDSMIERMESELGRKMVAVATGGLVEVVAQESRRIEKVHPFLTLEGLELLYRFSQPSSG